LHDVGGDGGGDHPHLVHAGAGKVQHGGCQMEGTSGGKPA